MRTKLLQPTSLLKYKDEEESFKAVLYFPIQLGDLLGFNEKVATMTRRAFAVVCLVHHLRPFLSQKTLQTVTHVLINSQLDYCHVSAKTKSYSLSKMQ